MVGFNGPVDSVLDATNDRIMQWGRVTPNNGKIIIAADPLDNISFNPDTIGMGLTFAKNYLANVSSDRGILLVPCASPGTGFSDGNWNPGDGLYESALSRTNAAVASNPNNVLKGILWHQGEKDRAWTQGQYAAALDAMVADFRIRATGAARVPFICGGTLVGGVQTAPGVSAALLDTPNRQRYSAYASSVGLTDGGDNLHFNATSLRAFGGRYYAAVQSALNNV